MTNKQTIRECAEATRAHVEALDRIHLLLVSRVHKAIADNLAEVINGMEITATKLETELAATPAQHTHATRHEERVCEAEAEEREAKRQRLEQEHILDAEARSVTNEPAQADEAFHTCGCADAECKADHGPTFTGCTRQATHTLYRIDMADNQGTRFCDACAEDACKSGLFWDGTNDPEDEDPICGSCGEPASKHSNGADDFSHCPDGRKDGAQ